jgi:hypothetical protein
MMRLLPVLGCALALAACSEPDTRAIPVEVQWAEWPAEVLAATPFTVRLLGYGPGCYARQELRVPVRVDQSAVTFEPYFLVNDDGQDICLPRLDLLPAGASPIPIDVGYYDTRAPVPGLAAQYPRTYEIRASAAVYAAPRLEALPVRMFGEVTVRSDSASGARTNAAGNVYAWRDSLGCVRLVPPFTSPGIVIENPPADTASWWSGFVRGYLYDRAASICGDRRVFHLVTRG